MAALKNRLRGRRVLLRGASLLLVAAMLHGCATETTVRMAPIKVEVARTTDGYQLLRGGEPYTIRGVGMGRNDVRALAAHGGNAIRNWTASDEATDTRKLLDDAHASGVTVALCLTVQAERWGFDYDDEEAVAAQLREFREQVLKYRDHPALLLWIIGNELNHEYTNSKVYDAVGDIAAMIEELDPNHPATTTLAGVDARALADIEARAPDLDFVSFQVYGGLFSMEKAIRKLGYEKPFMVTEWGAIGYWEVDATSWAAPLEATSTEKADVFLRGQRDVLDKLGGQLLGSYAFLWGQKQERTPTWFGMFTEDGNATEVVDVMHYLWNGTWPDNRVPQVRSLSLAGQSAIDNVTVEPGQQLEAVIDAVDPDGDVLAYRWELKPESEATQTGGDFEERIRSLEGHVVDVGDGQVKIVAPDPGFYRLFAYVYDGNGHTAHANIPFRVRQASTLPLAGEIMAIAYSGFREGQHPDRGDGAVNPSREQILEDLVLLAAHDFRLIRLYDAGENSRTVLELIREHDLPIKVLQGAWLRAELSNHDGCPWLDEPIPDAELAANAEENAAEVLRAIELAREFPDIIAAVNVGNEALVDWTDHLVPVDKVIDYVRQVRGGIVQPVTVAENYAWWARDGARLAAELDFVGVHTYPQWENKAIDEALPYTLENMAMVEEALPGRPLAILEAGWATVASEFGERASETKQARYFRELGDWAAMTDTTVFFFEAFDEPWKGNPDDPDGAEKHWGLFNVDRSPKHVLSGKDR